MIGIIGAMQEEVTLLQEEMAVEETVEKAGMVFYKGGSVRSESRYCKKWNR